MPEERHVIRQENLRALVTEAMRSRNMTQKAYAIQELGYVDDKYISQLMQPLDKEGSRTIGDRTADKIERKLNLPRGYLSVRHAPSTQQEPDATAPPAGDALAEIQAGIESLTALLLGSKQALARAFEKDLKSRARAHRIDLEGALLQQLLRIAREARVHTAKGARTGPRHGTDPSKNR